MDRIDASGTASLRAKITMQALALEWLKEWEAAGGLWIQLSRLFDMASNKETALDEARYAFAQVQR